MLNLKYSFKLLVLILKICSYINCNFGSQLSLSFHNNVESRNNNIQRILILILSHQLHWEYIWLLILSWRPALAFMMFQEIIQIRWSKKAIIFRNERLQFLHIRDCNNKLANMKIIAEILFSVSVLAKIISSLISRKFAKGISQAIWEFADLFKFWEIESHIAIIQSYFVVFPNQFFVN